MNMWDRIKTFFIRNPSWVEKSPEEEAADNNCSDWYFEENPDELETEEENNAPNK